LHWRNKLLQTCFRRFHMAHKASKSMENIEFLAVGQLLWRKARCYLRHLAFTTWHLSTVSYTRALKKAHRTVLISATVSAPFFVSSLSRSLCLSVSLLL
jgi:predicted signal transduction protein with EAL and GGDEF domain